VEQRPSVLSIDTIATFSNPAVSRFERVLRNSTVRNGQPFHARSFAVGAKDGSRFCGVTSAGGETHIRCTDASGRETLNRRLNLRPRPLTNAIYDSVIRVHMVGGSQEGDLRSKIQRPPALPPVHDLMVNRGGEVWLKRSHYAERDAVWTRVRVDGSIRDEFTIAARYRIVRPDGDFMWAATADSDGLETLHKCRIGG
jgi:hypothetical protein